MKVQETRKGVWSMSKWFMVCEVEKIDLVKALRQLPTFSLPMQENVTVDDEIYVYLKAPFDALMYQLRVTAIKQAILPAIESKYYDNSYLNQQSQYCKVEVLEMFPPDLFTLDFLEKNGLTQLNDFAPLSEEVAYSIEYHEAEMEDDEEEEVDFPIDEIY